MASDGDRQKRARDADRDRVVAALDDAYVDGQLDADEREARIEATLSARTLAELDAVIADLQRDDALPDAPKKSGWWASAIAITAAVLVLGVVGWRVVGEGPEPADTSIGSVSEAEPAVSDEDVVMWSDVEGELGRPAPAGTGIRVPEIQGWSGSEEDIRALIDAYRSERGEYVTEAWLAPEYATFGEPLSGADPRRQTWSYYPHDPVLRASGAAPTGLRDQAVIDLGDLDVDRLFANLEKALTEMNIDDATLAYISFDATSGNGAPEIHIYVRHRKYSDEVSYLYTTLDGEITSKYANGD